MGFGRERFCPPQATLIVFFAKTNCGAHSSTLFLVLFPPVNKSASQFVHHNSTLDGGKEHFSCPAVTDLEKWLNKRTSGGDNIGRKCLCICQFYDLKRCLLSCCCTADLQRHANMCLCEIQGGFFSSQVTDTIFDY